MLSREAMSSQAGLFLVEATQNVKGLNAEVVETLDPILPQHRKIAPSMMVLENAGSRATFCKECAGNMHTFSSCCRSDMTTDRGTDKEVVVCIHTVEYYSAMEKNEVMPSAATWVDTEIVILSDASQREKDNDIANM